MGGHRILIVDDISSVRAMLSKSITRLVEGVTVVSCGTAEEAIERITADRFDLVFLDINLGSEKMNGIETLRTIKETRPDQDVCMITGYSVGEESSAVIREHATGILEKPFRLDDLNTIIKRVLGE